MNTVSSIWSGIAWWIERTDCLVNNKKEGGAEAPSVTLSHSTFDLCEAEVDLTARCKMWTDQSDVIAVISHRTSDVIYGTRNIISLKKIKPQYSKHLINTYLNGTQALLYLTRVRLTKFTCLLNSFIHIKALDQTEFFNLKVFFWITE